MIITRKAITPSFGPNHFAAIDGRWVPSTYSSTGYRPASIAAKIIDEHALSKICDVVPADIAAEIRTVVADLIPGTNAYFRHICEVTLQNRMDTLYQNFVTKLHDDDRLVGKIVQHLQDFRMELVVLWLAKNKEHKDLMKEIHEHKIANLQVSKEHFAKEFWLYTEGEKHVIAHKIAKNFETAKVGFDKTAAEQNTRSALSVAHETVTVEDHKVAKTTFEEHMTNRRLLADQTTEEQIALELLARLLWERKHFSTVDLSEVNFKLAAYEAMQNYFNKPKLRDDGAVMSSPSLATEQGHELPQKVLKNLFAQHIKK